VQNQVASTQTTNIVPVQAVFNSQGQCLGLVGPGGTYFSPPLNADTITGATINSSSLGATTPSTVNATTLSINGDLMVSNVMPTIGSGFGTGATILGMNTAAFQITVGTGGASSGTITFPAATNGWVIQAWDITGANSLFIQQTGTTSTSASLASFGITTGTSSPMSAGDKILVMAMAF
jgi:hypothetical protein